MADDVSLERQRRDVCKYVQGRVDQIQKMYLSENNKGSSTRQLATLRRAIGREPGSSPDIWSLEFDDLPESIAGGGEAYSASEWAVHAALTLYATHQQSQQSPMHCLGRGDEYDFGAAVRRLIAQREGGENLKEGQMPRRFAAMVTSDSIEELCHYARQLVKMLRSASIPLDYARFAGQLFDYQFSFRRDLVRLQWGRSFARRNTNLETETHDDIDPGQGGNND